MKYILEYNNHTSYYEDITDSHQNYQMQQYLQGIDDKKKTVKLSKREFDVLRDLESSHTNVDSLELDESSYDEVSGSMNTYTSGVYYLNIEKCDDDWFYVQIGKFERSKKNSYFKCDQIDGVLKLLEDCADNKLDIDGYVKESVGYIDVTDVFSFTTGADDNKSYLSLSDKEYRSIKSIDALITEISGTHPSGQPMFQFLDHYFCVVKKRDEWYYVEFREIEKRNKKVFKCDQFDSLLSCIKDNLKLFYIEYNFDKLDESVTFFNSNSYYITCSSQELSDLVDTNDFIHLSKLDKDMILSIGLVEIDPDDRYKWCEFKVNKQFDSGDSLYLFSVWKCDDEWFYLELGNQVNGYSNICFKCDQIDGLVRCIEDCLTGQFDDKIDDLNESIVVDDVTLYKIVTEDDFKEFVADKKDKLLSNSQIRKINDLFYFREWNNDYDFATAYVNNNSCIGIWADIDEWFYVSGLERIFGYDNYSDHAIFRRQYAVCDSFEGLINYLYYMCGKLGLVREPREILESHSVEKLYYDMDEDDWRDEVRLLFGEKCSLSEKQVNELNVLFKIHHWKNVGASLDCTNLYIRFDNHLKEFELYHGADEWFYVKGYVEVAPNRIVDEYIKCDQWDGLVAYLTDSLGKFGCVKNQMLSESVLYSKVIEDDINTIDDDQKGLDFTDKEKDEISRALISVDYKGRHIVNAFDIQYRKIQVYRSYPESAVIFYEHNIPKKMSGKILFCIIKCSDEYYFVKEHGSDLKVTWYKCDQLDGLISFLTERKNKILLESIYLEIDRLLMLNESIDISDRVKSVMSKIKSLPSNVKRKALIYLITSLLSIASFQTVYNAILNTKDEDAIELCRTKEDTFKDPLQMSCSQKGIDHIKKEESLKLKGYKLGDGMITIGWGHAEKIAHSKFRVGQVISRQLAQKLFDEDLEDAEDGVKRIFVEWKKKGIYRKLTQDQYDVLVSMTFNMGIGSLRTSDMIKSIKHGDLKTAGEEITVTNISDKFPGLELRRAKESKMFLSYLGSI